MKLIDEWRSAWRFLSVQAAVVGGALLAGVQAAQQAGLHVPAWVNTAVGIVTVVGVVAGRVVSQDKSQ